MTGAAWHVEAPFDTVVAPGPRGRPWWDHPPVGGAAVGGRVRWALVGGAGLLSGLLSEQFATAWTWGQPLLWLPDLLTGWVVLACGVRLGTRTSLARPGDALLLLVTALTWQLANVLPVAVFWHRGPLVHLLVGRPRSLAGRAVLVVIAYGAAVTPALWGSRTGTVLLALAVAAAAVAAGPRTGHPGPVVRRRLVATAAGSWSAVLIAGAVLAQALPAGAAAVPLLLAYEMAVAAVALTLAAPVPVRAVPDIADLLVDVVDVGPTGATALRDALRRSVGDPGLEIGTWSAEAGCHLTPEGSPVPFPAPGGNRAATQVDGDDGPSAVVVTTPAALEGSPLLDAVAAAGRLTAAHAALRLRLAAQAEEVRRSRRRLLVAGDTERRRLQRQVHDGPERRLASVRARLRAVESSGIPPGPHLSRAAALLDDTVRELQELARGLQPRELDEGLDRALRAVVARSPVPVTLFDVAAERYIADVESAVYLAAAELLANVAKHARATSVRLGLRREGGVLRLTVADDGVGGAGVARGSGLVGVADRAAALGGRLEVTSPAGGGTTVLVELPVPERSADRPAASQWGTASRLSDTAPPRGQTGPAP